MSVRLGAREVFRSYDRQVLCGIDVDVTADEFVAIMGPSGSGKTTLLNLLGLLDAPDDGTITIDGVDVSALGDDKRSDRRARDIGMVFQDASLLPALTVAENVALPLHIGRHPRRERAARTEGVLETVGLGGFGARRPDSLSGGEAQRVALARAIVHEPALVLADEPTGRLDADTAAQIVDVLADLRDGSGRCIVMVTHDPAIAAHADRTLRLHGGRLVS